MSKAMALRILHDGFANVGLTTREKASGRENHYEAYGTENGDDGI